MSTINKVYYNKLVRDKIPEIIKDKQEQCEVRTITDIVELQQELFKKIKEEAASLAMARTKAEFIEEYADLEFVLETIVKQLGITPEEINQGREENILRKGEYNQQHFLVWSDDVSYKSNESPQGIPL